MTYESDAIELLQKVERFSYQGVDRHQMKLAVKDFVELHERTMLECCPFYMGLVVVSALRMLDECPDYF